MGDSQCWFTVCEAAPTLTQCWVNIFFFAWQQSHQIRDVDARLAWSWPTVCDVCPALAQLAAQFLNCDAGQTLSQHCINVSCFLGRPKYHPAITGRWPNAGLMLGQRRRRWLSINPALGQRLMFYGLLKQMGPCSPHIQLSLVFSAPRPDCS